MEKFLKEKFYYLRDCHGHPRTTVCLLVSPDGVISRGLSLCSYGDFVRKKEGRNKARGRAVQAIVKNESSKPVSLSIDSVTILNETASLHNIPDLLDCFHYLSEIAPNLLDFELEILEDRKNPTGYVSNDGN